MTAVDARAPARAPGLELLGEMQGSGYHEAPCTVRRADGQTIQVTPLLYQLLEVLDGGRGIEDAAAALSERCGRHVTAENVAVLIEDKLVPLGLVCDDDGAAPVPPTPTPLLALRCKFVVSDPDVTRRITSPFAVLFRRSIVVPVLLAFAITCWWVLFRHGLASGTRQAFDSPELLLGVFLLTVVSAGWHEFGHAAACRAAGATPGAMGAGLYLVWPAFYTDVDDAYRLDRWGRLKVDLGGLYFNAVAAVAVMAVWMVTRTDALLLAVASQLLLMLRQLAPVIRADGYHILSDLVGVPDLFQHLRPTLVGMLPTNWGEPQPLRPQARWIVRAWVLVVVPLLLWMFVVTVLLLPRLAATAWVGLQQQARAFTAAGADADLFGVLAAILKMFSLLLPVAAGVYLLVRVARKAARFAWTRTEDQPVARGALVVCALLVAILLAFAWWPKGQYQPVRADERGTVDRVFQLSSARTPQPTERAVPTLRGAGRPLPGVEARTGYALVPRDEDEATLLLVRDDDGAMRSIVTGPSELGGEGFGVAFPFDLPDAPGEGDNQALAVNTGDGTVVYDVAVALVWVKDGEVTDNRNEAYALASCTSCTTVAVAFQVVLVVGQSDVVAPVNVAVAANGGCISCQTLALAVQLVVTLREMPSEEVQAKIEASFGRLDGIDDLGDLVTEIQEVQAEILAVLYEHDLVDEDHEPTTDEQQSSVTTSTTVDGTSTGDEEDTSTSSSTSSTSSTSSSTTTTTERSTTTTTSTSTTSTTAPSTTTTASSSG